jgi:hypothetical protein
MSFITANQENLFLMTLGNEACCTYLPSEGRLFRCVML